MCSLVFGLVLKVVNVVVLLVGLAIMIVGALFTWSQSLIYNMLKPALEFTQSVMTSTDPSLAGRTDLAEYILDVFKYVGFPVFIFGCVLIGIAVCGLVGVCCGLRVLLIAYLAVTFVLTVAILTFIIVVFASSSVMDKVVTTQLKLVFKSYTGSEAKNLESLAVNLMQINIGCCGIDSGADFDTISTWPRNVTYDGKTYNLSHPISCCKFQMPNPKPVDSTCPTSFNANNSNVNLGCFLRIRQEVNRNSFVAAVVMGIIQLVLVVLMIFTSVIIGESKVGPI